MILLLPFQISNLDYYDLMLIDINMPEMNGFDFCVKALELDINAKVCFMSSGLINQEALREQYPSITKYRLLYQKTSTNREFN